MLICLQIVKILVGSRYFADSCWEFSCESLFFQKSPFFEELRRFSRISVVFRGSSSFFRSSPSLRIIVFTQNFPFFAQILFFSLFPARITDFWKKNSTFRQSLCFEKSIKSITFHEINIFRWKLNLFIRKERICIFFVFLYSPCETKNQIVA